MFPTQRIAELADLDRYQTRPHDVQETATEAAGVEPLEPGLERALQVLRDNPDQRPRFEAALISLLSPVKPGMVELVSFVMHELRWDAVRAMHDRRRHRDLDA
ncbi:hypothetical protein [Kribbella sp. NPDC050470]|uniref:hypothetical protein n=1 Tax=unclassified Kribbella TaxID=2644121 RepID=UPI0037B23D0E